MIKFFKLVYIIYNIGPKIFLYFLKDCYFFFFELILDFVKEIFRLIDGWGHWSEGEAQISDFLCVYETFIYAWVEGSCEALAFWVVDGLEERFVWL